MSTSHTPGPHWSERYPHIETVDQNFHNLPVNAQRLFIMMLEWCRVHDSGDAFIPKEVAYQLFQLPGNPSDAEFLRIRA